MQYQVWSIQKVISIPERNIGRCWRSGWRDDVNISPHDLRKAEEESSGYPRVLRQPLHLRLHVYQLSQ